MARLIHAVVPAGIDDPTHPSGGNTYDRRVLDALATRGWRVAELPVPGAWPWPTGSDLDGLRRTLRRLPHDAVVLADGLVACASAEVLVPAADRLRLAVLVHMPLRSDGEGELLRRAPAVITTSHWSRRRLVDSHGLDPSRITVAEPGFDSAAVAAPSPGGGRLLSVGVVAPHKGQDVLVDALARLDGLAFSCEVVGAVDVDGRFADRVRGAAAPLGDRVRFRGPLVGDDLAVAFARADLLLLPSRAETFGMVVGEALARGVPVVASDVGGVPLTLGHDPAGTRPGLLVDPGDAAALADAVRRWLTDPGLRDRLRRSARSRRETLTGWSGTADRVSAAVLGMTRVGSEEPAGPPRGVMA